MSGPPVVTLMSGTLRSPSCTAVWSWTCLSDDVGTTSPADGAPRFRPESGVARMQQLGHARHMTTGHVLRCETPEAVGEQCVLGLLDEHQEAGEAEPLRGAVA